MVRKVWEGKIGYAGKRNKEMLILGGEWIVLNCSECGKEFSYRP